MLDGITGIMNLAAAGGADLAETSDIVTDALTSFGQGADQAGRLADIMAAASSNSNTNVHLLGETFKYVASLAGGMGYSMEDTAVAIGLMANASIKGSQGGTALRSILTRLAKPTKESSTAMDALGISLEDGEGNMLTLMEVMEQMRDAFHNKLMIPEEEFQASLAELNQKLEDGEIKQKEYDESLEALTDRAYGAEGAMMAQYAAMLGGQEALSGLLAIVNATDEDFYNLADAIGASTGAAEDMAGKMQDNLAGDMKILKSAIQEAQISLADQLMPTLRMFAQTATESVGTATQKLNEYFASDAMQEKMQRIAEAIARVADAIANNLDPILNVIVGVIDGLSNGIAFLVENFGMIIETVKIAVAAFAGFQALNLVSTITGIITAVSAAITTAGGLGAAIAAVVNPVGLVVAAVAAGATLIITHWSQIKEFFGNLWEGIKSAWGTAKEFFVDTFTKAKEGIKSAWSGTKEFFANTWESIKSSTQPLRESILNVFSSVWEGIKLLFTDTPLFFKSVVQGIINSFISLPQTIRNIGNSIMDGLGDGLMDRLQSVVDKARSVASNILGAVKGFFGIASPSKVMRAEVGQQIGAGIQLGMEDSMPAIDGAVDAIGNSITGIDAGVSSTGGNTGRIEQLLITVIETMQRMGVTIDGKALVGYIAPDIDNYLGSVVNNLQREAVYV